MNSDRQWHWQALSNAYGQRSYRERMAIVMALLLLLLLLAEASVGSWLGGRQAEVDKRDQQLRLDGDRLRTELQLFSSSELEKNNRQQQRLIELLAAQLAQLETELGPLRKQALSSTELLVIVREMVAQVRNVTLLDMKILPREVAEVDMADYGEELEKHQLQLRLRGNYQALLQFLNQIESSGWPIFWQSLKYRIDSYPRAQMQLQIYTLRSDADAGSDNLLEVKPR
ncbi:MAG: hypothetical protein OIF38_15085 [Cellvibrionaceae bacterium]|nr:hypothetical protein [Cellvibrionaceae bacterium]